MNNYIVAISIVILGIIVHYAFFVSQREGLVTKEAKEQESVAVADAKKKAAEKAAAAKQAKENQETIDIWNNHAQSLLNTAKQQQQTIIKLENDNKTYQHILACLQYRKDLMNMAVAANKKGRASQGSDKKAKLKGVFGSAKKLS